MKRVTFKCLLCALALVGMLTCSSSVPWAQNVSPGESQDMKTAKVMGHLEHKGTVTTIHVGRLGSYYTIKDRDGRVIADRISERQLRSKFENIYDHLKRGLAGTWAGLDRHSHKFSGDRGSLVDKPAVAPTTNFVLPFENSYKHE